MHMLVVENSRRMQEAMRYALKPYGSVVTVRSAPEAMNALSQSPFDIVFTDFHMIGGSGLEVIDYVNKHHQDIPVVLITAYGTKELTIECLNRHIFAFLEKPVKYEELKDVLMKASQVRHKTQAEAHFKSLGMLSNLVFHEIGGSLQDLLNEVLSIELPSTDPKSMPLLGQTFVQLRDSIYKTSDAFRNLKALILEENLNESAFEEIDLVNLLNRVSNWLSVLTKSYGILLTVKVDEKTAVVRGLHGLVERAVKNVLINAVEALAGHDQEKTLEITLEKAKSPQLFKDEFHLVITNSGPMIPSEHVERIFDFAFSLKKERHLPRGMGLYVVDRVVKAMKGQVMVESKTDRTSFTMIFPASGARPLASS